MKHFTLLLGALILICTMNSCQQPTAMTCPEQAVVPTWDEQLAQQLPRLGHRNWIVIADMAYPLQSGSGITTLYADAPYAEVLQTVKQMIDQAPHVFAHVYRDLELEYISEEDMPGVDSLRAEMTRICGPEAKSIAHERLIERLDEAGRLYNVVIIKTPLTMAYTTTFFELDCAYWNGEQQTLLDERMSQGK